VIINIKEVFQGLSLDSIANCAFGIETNSFKNPGNDLFQVLKSSYFKVLKALIVHLYRVLKGSQKRKTNDNDTTYCIIIIPVYSIGFFRTVKKGPHLGLCHFYCIKKLFGTYLVKSSDHINRFPLHFNNFSFLS